MSTNFDNYNIPKDKYKELFASYLQTDGTQLMNKVKLKYDLINNYKNQIVNFWKLFDIDYLENEYIKWKNETNNRYSYVNDQYVLNNTSGTYVYLNDRNQYVLASSIVIDPCNCANDQHWLYTGFVENICNSYQITREYYSYWATTTENPDNPGNTYETTNILLNNLNMLRLLKIKRASVGFDGSRENLVQILKNALNNKYATSAEIQFVLRTLTEENSHATLQLYIIRPSYASNTVNWRNYDLYLVKDNQYFVQLLGIVIVEPEVIDATTLIFDSGKYDEKKYS
jgi:hypothetical protein